MKRSIVLLLAAAAAVAVDVAADGALGALCDGTLLVYCAVMLREMAPSAFSAAERYWSVVL